MKISYRRKSKAIICNAQGDILIARYNSPWEDWVAKRWIPGWWIDDNETYLHWIIREIYEEVGIIEKELQLVYTYPGYFSYKYSTDGKQWLQKQKNRYEDGEKIKFYVFRFLGDYHLDLSKSEEFEDYKWVDLHSFLEIHKPTVEKYLLSADIARIITKS